VQFVIHIEVGEGTCGFEINCLKTSKKEGSENYAPKL